MSEEDSNVRAGFVQEICEDSNDNVPLFIFSDWLKERELWRPFETLQFVLDYPDADNFRYLHADCLADHGSKNMAEFIRLQCQLNYLDSDGLYSNTQLTDLWNSGIFNDAALLWRDRNFILNMGDPTTAKFNPILYYRRGLIWAVSCYAADWLKYRVELVQNYPVQLVELIHRAPLQWGSYHYWHICEVCNSDISNLIHPDLINTVVDHTNYEFRSVELANEWLSKQLILRAKALAAK